MFASGVLNTQPLVISALWLAWGVLAVACAIGIVRRLCWLKANFHCRGDEATRQVALAGVDVLGLLCLALMTLAVLTFFSRVGHFRKDELVLLVLPPLWFIMRMSIAKGK